MGQKKLAHRSKVKPFIKVRSSHLYLSGLDFSTSHWHNLQVVNYSHLFPTRYALELEGLKGAVTIESFKEPSQRENSKKTIKKLFEDRYTSGKNKWFFQPLRVRFSPIFFLRFSLNMGYCHSSDPYAQKHFVCSNDHAYLPHYPLWHETYPPTITTFNKGETCGIGFEIYSVVLRHWVFFPEFFILPCHIIIHHSLAWFLIAWISLLYVLSHSGCKELGDNLPIALVSVDVPCESLLSTKLFNFQRVTICHWLSPYFSSTHWGLRYFGDMIDFFSIWWI